MTVTIKYFAFIREAVGVGEEQVELPADVGTVDEFLAWMAGRGEEFENIARYGRAIRVALDQAHEDDRKASLTGVREIALFPPMTGG